ncbi:hypothetical protein COV24_02760 [candidate division WWE3 bacterium CG10_big_fil_rev_8_21_14_0_10_32_10]|uniref:Uncharacterized protein n=1 Tax=candidate division WWE3 bacterium CG10_big_fil_rev_8_21_14_0_10_32_10 TaxID=1975090 RepID=A0A2H0RAD1_UNCKA|nr:MAG: hypothetical protein COV24_02760 [candidate division WWE3 bacterium CG10_big_fil_rev_8_21_14_0_10_32_10]
MKSTPIVSEKNTKAEILEAYMQTCEALESKKQVSQESFRDQVLSEVEKIETELVGKKQESESLIRQINDLEQKLGLGEELKLTKENLENMKERINQERRSWDRNKKQLEKEMQEEADWKKQRTEKELSQREWEFNLEQKQKMKNLENKEKELEEKLKEYEKFKAEKDNFPKEIENEVSKALKINKDILQKDFETERKMLVQQNDSEQKLLKQRILDLETRLKDQKLETDTLRKELSKAREQIEQLAVAALRTKEYISNEQLKSNKIDEKS